jgi:hypothetical protein
MLSGDLPRHSHFVSNTENNDNQDNLTSSTFIQLRGRPNVSQLAYRLVGSATPPTLGPTSTTGSSTVADIKPLSYGVYVWKRTT